jgi:hypothetical protein
MIVGLLFAVALTVATERYRHALVPFLLPFAGLALDMLTQREPLVGGGARRAAVAGVMTLCGLAATVFLLPAP